MTIADQLRAAIRKSGLTQDELAAKAKVSQGRLSDFLAGKDVCLSTAAKLAKALGLSLTSAGRKR